jgi:2-keto-4-pentenoate hydratase/2-oxohepta-3-ene-1,7-dioic acid hydratase in catechol pathway
MRLCSYVSAGQPAGAVVAGDRLVPLRVLSRVAGRALPSDLDDVFADGAVPLIQSLMIEHRAELETCGEPLSGTVLCAPVRRPPKIWCIGLNYREHASDLDERSPDEPASFMRPAASICGPGDPIRLPPASERVTGEAELAVIIGRRCRYISRHDAFDVIAGVLPAIDMTAEDILRRNPRFLTRAKSFDTFLSLGPFVVTPDEVGDREALRHVRVTTLLNGTPERSNTGVNMTHDVFDLIAFHSRGMTWEPGDVLLTGTPGAVVIRPGDVIGCDVVGIGRLENGVTTMSSDRVLDADRATSGTVRGVL